MKNKLFPIFITSIFVIIFIFFYRGLQNSNIYTPITKINNKIPLFEGNLFDSTDIINSSNFFKPDKFYLLNIWSSWCVPCRKEHVLLINLKESNNLELIGINYRDNKKKAKQFIEDYGNPFSLILYDKKGTVAIELGAYGIPETFIINKDKKIVKKYLGALTDQNLKEIYSTLK